MRIFTLFIISFLFDQSYAEDLRWIEILDEDQIKVYKAEGEFKTIPFKAETVMKANISKILAVLKDMENKPKWSPKLDSVKVHEKISDQEYIFSEFYKTPWPSTDREFLLWGKEHTISQNQIKIIAKSFHDYKLKNSDYIQADVYKLDLLLTKLSETQTKIEFEFHGDLKGWLPTWLVNLIQKKWPMRFLQGLRNEATGPQISLSKN